jgi:hypothetical protein
MSKLLITGGIDPSDDLIIVEHSEAISEPAVIAPSLMILPLIGILPGLASSLDGIGTVMAREPSLLAVFKGPGASLASINFPSNRAEKMIPFIDPKVRHDPISSRAS